MGLPRGLLFPKLPPLSFSLSRPGHRLGIAIFGQVEPHLPEVDITLSDVRGATDAYGQCSRARKTTLSREVGLVFIVLLSRCLGQEYRSW